MNLLFANLHEFEKERRTVFVLAVFPKFKIVEFDMRAGRVLCAPYQTHAAPRECGIVYGCHRLVIDLQDQLILLALCIDQVPVIWLIGGDLLPFGEVIPAAGFRVLAYPRLPEVVDLEEVIVLSALAASHPHGTIVGSAHDPRMDFQSNVTAVIPA